MTHLSTFSGVGGFDLAAHWAGFTTIQMVEIDPFCQRVLAKNFPGVPIHGDIRTFKWALADAASLLQQNEQESHGQGVVIGSESRTSGRTGKRDHAKGNRDAGGVAAVMGSRRLTLLSGGPPCQPASVAGKRKGAGDERWLWGEWLRVVREADPLWVVAENPRGLLSLDGGRAFGAIVRDLAEMGYRVGWCLYGAAHVGAPHRRERVFIVAHANRSERGSVDSRHKTNGRANHLLGQGQEDATRPRELREDVSHDDGEGWPHAEGCAGSQARRRQVAGSNAVGRGPYGRLAESRLGFPDDGLPGRMARCWADGSWECGIPRVAAGVVNRVDKLKALGNAVVPAQAFPILQAIAEAC